MFRQSPQNDSFLVGSESRRHEPDFSISPFPNYSRSLFYRRMLYELLENDWGSLGSARQPPANTQGSQTRPTNLFSETRVSQPGVEPGVLLGSPGCSWVPGDAPGLLPACPGKPGEAQTDPDSTTQLFHVKLARISLAWVLASLGLFWLLLASLAAAGVLLACLRPPRTVPRTTQAEAPK